MFHIAGQTAGNNGLNFFVDIHGKPWGDKAKFFFHGQRRALQLIVNKVIIKNRLSYFLR